MSKHTGYICKILFQISFLHFPAPLAFPPNPYSCIAFVKLESNNEKLKMQ